MEDKLARLEEQMRKLIKDVHDAYDKNEELRRQNERLLNELLEKKRNLEVLEERSSLLMETQASKERLEQQRERIRKEAEQLLARVRALKGCDAK